ncbi:hypothetical protein ACFL3D_00760 [Candidatus Omnitrophota bacterium]
MNKKIYFASAFIFIGIILMCDSTVYSYTDKDALNKEEKSLQEILQDEKTRQYEKIDDFLANFDTDYTKNIGDKFEDLLGDESVGDTDEDEINTDSFEEFNTAFDKMIEEDLADFELIDIDTEDLEGGLKIDSLTHMKHVHESDEETVS